MAARTLIPPLIACILLSTGAWAHDHKRPDLDRWYESLRVPSDGLALSKGSACCNRLDCTQRLVRRDTRGLYSVRYQGRWLPFTAKATITDRRVRASNPYFQATVCIYRGEVVCHVPGRVGG